MRILNAVAKFFADYALAWVNIVSNFVWAVINEFGLWSATPLLIVLILIAMSFVPVIGGFPRWLFGFVVGNAYHYFKRLVANVFAVWVFLIFLAYPPLGQFARFRDTISMDAQQALLLLVGLVAQAIVCFLAARRQWRYVTDMGTTIDALKFESRTSGAVAVALTYISAWLISRHYMPWGLYIPWLFSVYTAWEIWDRSVNTAGLKPVTQMQQTH